MHAIKIMNLTFMRQQRAIFSHFNLEIKQGKFVALLGPNGTGKSTLLKLMAGLLSRQQGDISLLNRSLSSMKTIERAKFVSYMPQFSHLETAFTVEQVVRMGRYPHKKRFSIWNDEDEAKVAVALERAEISHLKDRYLPSLSGGERQLVYLAKAIAQDTPILLLDEPTSDLDIYHQIIVMNVLKKLQLEGKTIVAAIHDLNLAARECDECVLIREGNIVSYGLQDTVIDPQHIEQGYQVNAHIYEEPITNIKQIIPYEIVRRH